MGKTKEPKEKSKLDQRQLNQYDETSLEVENVFSKIEDLNITEDGIIPFLESTTLEYKQSIPKSIELLTKLLVAMANTEGGCVVFGVRETKRGGVIIGLDDDGLKRFSSLEKEIVGLIEKGYSRPIDIKFGKFHIKGKTIAFIFVQKSQDLVISVKGYYIIRESNFGSQTLCPIGSKELKELDIHKHTHFTRLEIPSNLSLFWHFNGNKRPMWKFVYKYMTLDAFIQCIEHGNIMFQEPCGWKDQFESRFYKADYTNITKNTYDTPKVFASCFTRERDCEASWKVYANNGDGLKSRCVQIKIDVDALREQLIESAQKCMNHKWGINGVGIKCDVYEGEVSYLFDEYEISRFHENKPPFYNLFFETFNLHRFIGLLLFKRPAYGYEKEVRFFMVPTLNETRQLKARKAEKLFVDLQWEKIIKLVRCDKNCTDSEVLALKTICEKNGIVLDDIKTCKNEYKKGKKIHVPFESFDIDRMQGKKSITIQ